MSISRQNLIDSIRSKQSFLCVGLDSDITKMPDGVAQTPEGVLQFNKAIIDATADYAVSYKLNTAFYESFGVEGWQVLKETITHIPKEQFIIADAKRGDIGNTSTQYAKAFYEAMSCDAVTVAPYMGEDSVAPFLAWQNKWAIVLALTSNAGSADFQMMANADGMLHEEVLRKVSSWGTPSNLMFVVGATKAQELQRIRKIVPEHFLLVPGVGAQGGSLQDVYQYGANADCGLLVNVSRGIIFADSSNNYATTARIEAQKYQAEMQALLNL
jgi:orotidine-5'-phosphate decarboxylase